MHRFKNIVFKDENLSEVIFKILRTILSFSNCVIIISSVVLMFTGEDLGEPDLIETRKVFIYACIVLLLVGILGLVGAILENFGLLIGYAFLWSFIVIIKAAELRRENFLSFIISLALCICAVIYAALIRYAKDEVLLTRKLSRRIAG